LKSSDRLRLRILSCLGIVLGLGAAAVFLLGIYLGDMLYARHLRAEKRWAQRKPAHYIYNIEIRSSYWTNRFQIEILNNGIEGILNLDSGQPAEIFNMEPGSYLHTTNALWQYLLIDNIFQQIQFSIKPPRTGKAFLARTNPDLYIRLAIRGALPYDWQGCEQAYPHVRYEEKYGYPSEVYLYGQPCSTVIDLVSPISLAIEDFRTLP